MTLLVVLGIVFIQGTSVGALVFHCERRALVLLRDIFRFGTATAIS